MFAIALSGVILVTHASVAAYMRIPEHMARLKKSSSFGTLGPLSTSTDYPWPFGTRACYDERYLWIIPAAGAYFVAFVGNAMYIPFVTLWLDSCGMDLIQIESLFAIFLLCRCIAPYLWGRIADATQQHRLVLVAVGSTNALLVATMTYIPGTLKWQAVVLPLAGLTDCFANLEAAILRSLVWAGERKYHSYSRAFACLAYGLMAPFAGMLIDSGNGIAALFRLYAIIMSLGLVVASQLPITRAYDACKPPKADSSNADSLARTRGGLVCSPRLIFFLSMYVLIGAHMGLSKGLGLLFYKDQLGASGLELGLVESLPALLQVPMFFFADDSIDRLGLVASIGAALAAGAARHAAYFFATQPRWLLPFEFLYAITFVAEFTVRMRLTEESSTRGMQSSAAGTFAAYRNGGMLLGAFTAMLASVISMSLVFALSSAVLAAAAVPIFLYSCRRCDAKESSAEKKQEQ